MKLSDKIRVAVVGCGYWGPNLVRNFEACPTTCVTMICDQSQERLNRVGRLCPFAKQVDRFEAVLDADDVDAVVIATPVSTHGPLSIAALTAGKHVLVEKPMADNVEDAEKMVATASAARRVLMVDHTFVYSAPITVIKRMVDAGELGDIYFVDSVRINLGLFQHDINVIWDLAPHDLSILDYLIPQQPRSLAAFGSCHASKMGIEDVAYLNLEFNTKLIANLHVNWLSPVKIRHFMIGGSKKSIVYNDLDPNEKIKVYDCGITVKEDVESRSGILVGYRTGDVWSPRLPQTEPLQSMVAHFADCIASGQTPITDGHSGLRVVKMLRAAQRSVKSQGLRIQL